MVNNYGRMAQTDHTCPFALLETGWVVFNGIRRRLAAQFGKLCFHWKKQVTNVYRKSAEQGQKWGWTAMARSHNLEVSQ